MRTCVKLVVLALALGGSGCADTPTLTPLSRPLRDGGAYLGAGFSKGGGAGGTGGIYNEPQTTTVNSDSTTITGPTAPDGRGGTIGSGG